MVITKASVKQGEKSDSYRI